MCVFSFIVVLTCLILSVVSTVEQFQDISDHILFYVVSYRPNGSDIFDM